MLKFKWVGLVGLVVLAMGLWVSVGDLLGQESQGPEVLSASITSSQEVPAPEGGVPGGAVGEATLWFNPTDNTVTFLIAYANMNGALTVAHFHGASAGTAGGVVQTICGQPEPAIVGDCPAGGNSGFLFGTWEVPDDMVEPLLSGGIYINLHTATNPAGELRGQIFPK